MVDHHAEVEGMDGVNADKLFEAMEIEFGDIMDDVEVENIRNVENIANVAEYIRNVDPEQFANIRDEIFEVLEIEVDFENIMDQKSSDEEMLSDDSGCASDMSEYEIDRVEKFMQPSEIRTLNARTKYCVIYNYYTRGALTVCTACMIRIDDINDVGMYHVREHEIGSFGRLDGKSCTNCREPLYSIFSCNMCPFCTH